MSEDLNQRSRFYAERYDVRLTERLGFGIHGIVHVVESNAKPGRTAIKVHRDLDPFVRECLVYERLRVARVTSIMDYDTVTKSHMWRWSVTKQRLRFTQGEAQYPIDWDWNPNCGL